MQSFSTADLLDEYPESIVLMENFVSYGELSTFFGKAKTIVAPEDNSLVRQALETKGNNQKGRNKRKDTTQRNHARNKERNKEKRRKKQRKTQRKKQRKKSTQKEKKKE